MEGEDTTEPWRQRWERCSHSPRDAWSSQTLEEAGPDSPREPSEGAQPCHHLEFRLLASKTVTTLTFCCFKPPNCGNMLQKPQETNTAQDIFGFT